MRTYATAYLGYGVKLPRGMDRDQLQEACTAASSMVTDKDDQVGWLLTGDDPGEDAYLLTRTVSVSALSEITVDLEELAFSDQDQHGLWDEALLTAVNHLGIRETATRPGWLLICDLDH